MMLILGFGKLFAQNFFFFQNEKTSRSTISSDEILKKHITEACRAYKKKHGRAPVLVLDNFNLLLNLDDGQKYLELFQDFAKIMADQKLLVVVFVTSEGKVPNVLLGRSSASRMRKPIEIGDINEKDAIDYLQKRICKNEKEEPEKCKGQSKSIYDIVGGRFRLLKTAIATFENTKSIDQIKVDVLEEAAKEFEKLKKDSRNFQSFQ